jgi:hypothetical protein
MKLIFVFSLWNCLSPFARVLRFYILFQLHVGQLFDSLKKWIFESRVLEKAGIELQNATRTRTVKDMSF